MRVTGIQLAAAGLLESHAVGVRVDIVSRTGTVLGYDIPVGEDIALTLDATATVRRHVSFSVVDPERFMGTTGVVSLRNSDIDPAKVNLMNVYASMFNPVGGGGNITFQVAQLVVTDPSLHDPGLGLKMEGYDLAALVSAYNLVQPYAVVAGTNVATAIADLIDFAVPAPVLPKSFTSTSAVLPAGIVLNEGDDAMDVAAAWAKGAGLDLFFGATGVLILRAAVDPYTAAAVWTYFEGVNAVMEELDQTLSVIDSYSHVIALGQTPNGNVPIRADAFDTTPSSPTYYLGNFGDRVAPILRGDFDSYATALTAATAELRRKKGTSQTVEITGVPIAAHDEQDIISIERPVSDLDYLTDKFLIESATIPLSYVGSASVRAVGRIL